MHFKYLHLQENTAFLRNVEIGERKLGECLSHGKRHAVAHTHLNVLL
jgi:hypothetical protein